MTTIVASAPGKVVLSGEYAVLFGHPAVSMAVDRRAVAEIDESGDDELLCSGATSGADPGIRDCVCDVLGIEPVRGALRLDTSAFVDPVGGIKLGIGSSAALTAALTRALAPKGTDAAALLDLAARAHAALQGGRGSGVDVATSVSGGLIRYTRGASPSSLGWPRGLHYALLWSGQPVTTAERVDRVTAAPGGPALRELGSATAALADAWSSGDAAAVVDGYPDYISALRAFDVDHSLGIFDAGHDVLTTRGSASGVVYKPCGAGGGDVGIALGRDAGALAAFAADAEATGFHRLDAGLDPAGARLDETMA